MLTKEQLDSWNEIFPEGKITEKDLQRPTEAFFTRALLAYLNEYYRGRIPSTMPPDDQPREKVRLLIWIARHVDHILKITNKSYAFYYYDLIAPSPKKTQHVLGILLNYIFYYNMYQVAVKNLATPRISQLEEVQRNLGEAKTYFSQCETHSKEIKERTSQLNNELPALRKEFDQLQTQHSTQTKKISELQENYTEQCTDIEQLSLETIQLKQLIVSEKEIDELRAQWEKLKETIEEQSLAQNENESCYHQVKEQISNLEEFCDDIQKVHQLTKLPLESFEAANNISKKLKAYDEQAKQLNATRSSILERLQRVESDLNKYTSELRAHMKKFKDEQSIQKEAFNTLIRQSQTNIAKLTKLKELVTAELDLKLDDQKAIANYLEQMNASILPPTKFTSNQK